MTVRALTLSPEREARPRAFPAIILWLQTNSAGLNTGRIVESPMLLGSDNPSGEVGHPAGTTIFGTDGSVWTASSDGTPVQQATVQLTGQLADLDTTDKATLVAAINEVLAASSAAVEQVQPMFLFGPWGLHGDGAETNGGGLVGATPTLTQAANGQAMVNHGATWGMLSAVVAGYGQTYQPFPDAPANDDAVYFGASVKFAEIAFDSATGYTFTGDACAWEYWNGAAWSPLPAAAYDNTDSTAQNGKRPFQRDGALTFAPPADWAQATVNGVTVYWVRSRVTDSTKFNLTGKFNTKNHEVVTPNGGFVVRQQGTLTTVRISDGAATKHAANPVKFVILNLTTGECTSEMSFNVGLRCQRFTGLTLACAAGDSLGVYCTAQDGTNEPNNVALELGFTVA